MYIRGNKIDNEFDLLCLGYEIEGALKVRLSKIYKAEGMGGAIAELRDFGDENTLKEEAEHTQKLIEEREVLSRLLPDPKKRKRRRHQSIEMAKKFFGIGKEREGD
jgi:hypothetical protein